MRENRVRVPFEQMFGSSCMLSLLACSRCPSNKRKGVCKLTPDLRDDNVENGKLCKYFPDAPYLCGVFFSIS